MRVRFHAPETPRKAEFAAKERPFARQVPHWADAAHLRRRIPGQARLPAPITSAANITLRTRVFRLMAQVSAPDNSLIISEDRVLINQR